MFIILDELQNHLQVKKPVGLTWLYVTFINYVVVNLSFVHYSLRLPPKIQSSSFSIILYALETDLCELCPKVRSISNVYRWWKMLARCQEARNECALFISPLLSSPSGHHLLMATSLSPHWTSLSCFSICLPIIASSSWPFRPVGADGSVLAKPRGDSFALICSS